MDRFLISQPIPVITKKLYCKIIGFSYSKKSYNFANANKFVKELLHGINTMVVIIQLKEIFSKALACSLSITHLSGCCNISQDQILLIIILISILIWLNLELMKSQLERLPLWQRSLLQILHGKDFYGRILIFIIGYCRTEHKICGTITGIMVL